MPERCNSGMGFFGQIYRCELESGHDGAHRITGKEEPIEEPLKEMHQICHEVFLR